MINHPECPTCNTLYTIITASHLLVSSGITSTNKASSFNLNEKINLSTTPYAGSDNIGENLVISCLT